MVLKTRALMGLTALSFTLSSCRSIVLNVSKKGKGSETSSVGGSEANKELNGNIEDVEGAIANLKNLQKEAIVAFALQKLKGGWRDEFRSGLRSVRENIVRNSQTEHNYDNRLIALAKDLECKTIEKQDLNPLKDYEKLGLILELSMIGYLGKENAIQLDPKLPEKIDEMTKIILFELGVQSKGQSKITVDGNKQILESTIVWKVIHEKTEDAALEELDKRAVAFVFKRVFVDGKAQSFDLEARVAEGLIDGKSMGEEFYMTMKNEWSYVKDGAQSITMQVENGIKGKAKAYAREVVFSRDGANKDFYHLKDTSRKGMANQSVAEAKVDFAALKSCHVAMEKDPVKGTISPNKELVKTIGDSLSPGKGSGSAPSTGSSSQPTATKTGDKGTTSDYTEEIKKGSTPGASSSPTPSATPKPSNPGQNPGQSK